MIRKFIGRLLSRAKPAGTARAGSRMRRYRGADLGIRRDDVSTAALRTCEGLQQAGFKAYVVGGGVRDALAQKRPKDFDVATDATPQQVVEQFRRSRLIGRRFQIVHVIFGRETIEVSTFRALQTDAETDDHGRVLRDNAWGTLPEDAARRDVTINALYYDPVADEVLDFHDGVSDMKKGVVRMIGDPTTRFREDPVRMLRVARFAAKLGFQVEAATRAPMRELAPLVSNVPSARLFDEMLKLLTCGNALECLHELRKAGLHDGLLPMLDVILGQPDGERFIRTALARTDERVRQEKTVSPGFLFATLLWQQVNKRWAQGVSAGEHRLPALFTAIDSVIDEQATQLAIQKRYAADMREIWTLQPRFEKRNGQSPYRLIEHPRFRAAYDFMLLRCETGDAGTDVGAWWSDFLEANPDSRKQLVDAAARSGSERKRPARKRRRKSRSPLEADPAALASAAAELEERPVNTRRAPRDHDHG